MNVFFPRRRLRRMGPGVGYVEIPRLHIGWNEDDISMWDELPFCGQDGKLAYKGGAVIVIHEYPDNIRISIIKSHTGKNNSKVGKVRVVEDRHTTEVIIDNPVVARGPRNPSLLARLRGR